MPWRCSIVGAEEEEVVFVGGMHSQSAPHIHLFLAFLPTLFGTHSRIQDPRSGGRRRGQRSHTHAWQVGYRCKSGAVGGTGRERVRRDFVDGVSSREPLPVARKLAQLGRRHKGEKTFNCIRIQLRFRVDCRVQTDLSCS